MKGLIDLHLHLDGSLSLETVKELSKIEGIAIDSDDELIKKLRVSENCRDLNEYLEKFDFPLSLLQSRKAIKIAVSNLLEELKSENILYAEIRFAPQLHTKKGLSQQEVVEAAIEGLNNSIKSNLILCCMRGNDNINENIETVNIAEKYLGKGVCAIDLAGAEALYTTEKFGYIFELASSKNIPFTIHAGEAMGAESIRKALEFGAKRIGHGVRAFEDNELMEILAESKIPLELCPTSNLNTRVFEDIQNYPIRKFMEKGVVITINTDNRTVSNTNIMKEIDLVKNAFSLSNEDINSFILNGAIHSFADEDTKEFVLEKVRGDKL